MLNWPRDNNHFNSSGEIFTPLRKFYFSDKNQEVHDSNDTDSLLAHAMSRGVSSIIEGLYPISLTDGNTIGISYGSFITSSTDVLDNSSLETTERYQKLNTSNMSVIKVGKIFDEPIQVRTAGYLHLPHKLLKTGFVDPVFGTQAADVPQVFLKGDQGTDTLEDPTRTELYSSATNKTNIIPLASNSTVGTDCLVTFSPFPEATWVTSGTTYTAIAGTTNQRLIIATSPFTTADLYKTVEITRPSDSTVHKRIITRIISGSTIELSKALIWVPSVSDTFLVYPGHAIYPAADTRQDVIAISKETYEQIAYIAKASSVAGGTTAEAHVVRQFVSFGIKVFEFVAADYDSTDCLKAASIAKYYEFYNYIPLARVNVSTTAITSYTHTLPWLECYRDRGVHNNNLVQNGSFEHWNGSVLAGLTDIFYAKSPIAVTKYSTYVLSNTAISLNAVASGEIFAYRKTIGELGIQQGDLLLFSASVMAPYAKLRVRIGDDPVTGGVIAEGNGSNTSTATQFTTLYTSAYVPFTEDITPDSYVSFWIVTGTSATCLIDNMCVTKIGSSRGYIPKAITEIGNQYIDGNVYINGSVTITGDTTELNVTQMKVLDPIITLNKGQTLGTPIPAAGIEVESAAGIVASIKYVNATSTWDADKRMKDSTGFIMPVGSIIAYGGATAPTGWFICNGDTQLCATYPELYAAIGDAWYRGHPYAVGVAFNLPDLRNRIVRGAGSQGIYNSITADPAVPAGTDRTTIPVVNHLDAAAVVTIVGTSYYDGTYTLYAATAFTITITHAYIPETFAGTEYITVGTDSAEGTAVALGAYQGDAFKSHTHTENGQASSGTDIGTGSSNLGASVTGATGDPVETRPKAYGVTYIIKY